MNAQPPVGSLARAFTLLEAVAASDGLSITELAERTGLDKSIVSRLARSLIKIGYLHRRADRALVMSGRVLSLARGFEQQFSLREVARPVLVQLCRSVGETVHLGFRSGSSLLYVDEVVPARDVVVRAQLGRLSPLYETAMGRAIMFHLSHDEQVEILRACADQPVEHEEVRIEEHELAQLQLQAMKDGYTTVARNDDLSRVGSVVFDALDRPHAAVGVYGPAYRMRPAFDVIAKRTRAAAAKVSELLGGHREATFSGELNGPWEVATTPLMMFGGALQ